jgi:hypothetical protein
VLVTWLSFVAASKDAALSLAPRETNILPASFFIQLFVTRVRTSQLKINRKRSIGRLDRVFGRAKSHARSQVLSVRNMSYPNEEYRVLGPGQNFWHISLTTHHSGVESTPRQTFYSFNE